MARVIQFEIAADNPERAIAFYENVFGWRFEKWGGPIEYWVITTTQSEGLDECGGLVRRRGPDLGQENTVWVESIDEAVSKILACGGKIIRPKAANSGSGWLAYCQDTEGNTFRLTQVDPPAGG